VNRIVATALVASAIVASAPAQAATTVYSSLTSFTAATTGVTTNNFEGASSEQSVLIFPNAASTYAQPGFTLKQTTGNAFLSDPAGVSRFYYYDWGTGDVINTPYGGVMTVTFNAPVTAFAIDLGVFYGAPFPYPTGTIPGAATTLYGGALTIGTAQGNFNVNTATTRNFTFFGVTSDTAFTSFTITGAGTNAFASTVFDNIRFGSAATPAVPEPATWAMMIGGFGMVGGAMRYRRRKTSVSFA
jgi:hypothetical protein